MNALQNALKKCQLTRRTNIAHSHGTANCVAATLEKWNADKSVSVIEIKKPCNLDCRALLG
jgi:hypothetical protein